MKNSFVQILIAATFVFSASRAAASDPRPVYEMNSFYTYLWDMDVDYYSRPIVLVRTEKTQAIHRIEFNVNHYTSYCAYYENRCVQTDQYGRCVRWERVCARWEQRVQKVGKRIELNFRKAAALQPGQEERYELDINLNRPAGDGEDWVRTWLRDEATIAPVKVRRFGDFSYSIELK